MSILMSILNLFGTESGYEPTGANAIVTDYNERKMLEKDGKQVDAILIDAERIIEKGTFHDRAVAQLWFDLGKYGEYPITLDLPEGPNDDSELEEFMDRLDLPVEALSEIVEDMMAFPFIRENGEWEINWERVGSETGE